MKRFQVVAVGLSLGLAVLIGATAHSATVRTPTFQACPQCGPTPLCDPNDPKCTLD